MSTFFDIPSQDLQEAWNCEVTSVNGYRESKYFTIFHVNHEQEVQDEHTISSIHQFEDTSQEVSKTDLTLPESPEMGCRKKLTLHV